MKFLQKSLIKFRISGGISEETPGKIGTSEGSQERTFRVIPEKKSWRFLGEISAEITQAILGIILERTISMFSQKILKESQNKLLDESLKAKIPEALEKSRNKPLEES